MQPTAHCRLKYSIPAEAGPRPRLSSKSEAVGLRGKTQILTLSGSATLVFCLDVFVGDESCNQVAVRNLQLRWTETVKLRVYHDRSPCLIDAPPTRMCSRLLRLVDENGSAISGARVTLGNRVDKLWESDAYGRVLVGLEPGESEATVSVSGFADKKIHLSCDRGSKRLEQLIVMDRH